MSERTYPESNLGGVFPVKAHQPEERLSITLAREHCNDGHGGEFEAYCYRCQFFEERREAWEWQKAAILRKRFWLTPEFGWRVFFGDDEYWRRTLVLGPLVIALWRTREDAREYIAERDDFYGTYTGQRDRDIQGRP